MSDEPVTNEAAQAELERRKAEAEAKPAEPVKPASKSTSKPSEPTAS
jgi:hypothetical protein